MISVIVYLVAAVFVFFLFYRYKETIVIISVFSLVLQMPYLMKNMSLFDFLAIVSLFVFGLKNKKIDYSYPFMLGSLLVASSYVFTNLFAPSESHWPTTILSFVSVFCFPMLLWQCLKNGDNRLYKLFIRSLLSFLVCIIVYGLYELLTDSNPAIEYIMDHRESFVASIGLSERERFGIRRLQSFLTYNSALGVISNMGIIMLCFLWSRQLYLRPKYKVLAIFLVVLSLFTGTRSVYVGLFFALLSFVFVVKMKLKYVISISIMAGLFFLIFQSFFEQIYQSFVDTENVAGSNVEMREGQFEISYYFMSQTGIFGNGFGFLSYVTENFREEILGAESVWIPLMVNQGYYGVFVYAAFLFMSLYYCVRRKYWVCVLTILSFIATKTLTSAPGINNAYFLIFVVFFINYTEHHARYQNRSLLLS